MGSIFSPLRRRGSTGREAFPARFDAETDCEPRRAALGPAPHEQPILRIPEQRKDRSPASAGGLTPARAAPPGRPPGSVEAAPRQKGRRGLWHDRREEGTHAEAALGSSGHAAAVAGRTGGGLAL